MEAGELPVVPAASPAGVAGGGEKKKVGGGGGGGAKGRKAVKKN